MPHDAHGNLIVPGDEVLIRYRVKSVSPQEGFCNCQLESINGRKPDGAKETYCGNISVCELVPPSLFEKEDDGA